MEPWVSIGGLVALDGLFFSLFLRALYEAGERQGRLRHGHVAAAILFLLLALGLLAGIVLHLLGSI